MTPKTCHGCTYARVKYVVGYMDNRLRCHRPQTGTGGVDIPLSDNGVDCVHETDGTSEPQRAIGDKCGPFRVHFIAGEPLL